MTYSAISSYRKSIKVIESCTNQEHIKFTRNYINNFFNHYSSFSRKNYGPFKTYYIEDWIGNMYNRLLVKLEEKKITLNL